MKLRFIALVASTLTQLACGTTMTIKEFVQETPPLVLEEYFDGKTHAYGLFEDRFGRVRNQFTVMVDGHWDGSVLTLDEDFVYNNGDTEYRKWQIEKTSANTYIGTTQQIIGEAAGETSGNAFHWTYKFKLNVGEEVWDVKFDDWMFLQPDGVLLNKATVYRWGFTVGTVFLSFSKVKPALNARTGSQITEPLWLTVDND